MEASSSEHSGVFNKWVGEHGKNYVAHATENHNTVLQAKVLRSAEDILREQGKVEHESGAFATRNTTEITQYPPSKRLTVVFTTTVSKKTGGTVERAIYPNFSKEYYEVTKPKKLDPTRVKVKDFGDFTVVKRYEAPDKSKKPRIQGSMSGTKEATTENSLVQDEFDGRPVDHQLRKVYAYILKKGVKVEDAVEALTNIRSNALNTHVFRLEDKISVSKNAVRWDYGPIAIIMGKPNEKVTSPTKFEKAYPGGELRLKGGFQIAEGFYQEKLDGEENIILGPKYLLDKYRADPKIADSVKARFVDIESLTQEQWPLFNLTEQYVKTLCTPKEPRKTE